MMRSTLSILASTVLICVAPVAPTSARAQDSDTAIRLDQMEHQMRELTGQIEQLQYRNQQLEQAVRALQDQQQQQQQQFGARGTPTTTRPTATMPAQSPPAPSQTPAQTYVPGRRSDAFDPTQNPNAPGAPRTLGSLTSSNQPNQPDASMIPGQAPVGSGTGRPVGEPLNLTGPNAGTYAAPGTYAPPGQVASTDNGSLPPPPPRNPNATGGQLPPVLPPSQSPRDEYDLAYGYLLRKDYAAAEDSFRIFLRNYPNDPLASEAQFWFGESLFQRQNYRDAADAFLNVTKQNTAKAPDALLRLGESLAAIGEKDLACATFGEVAHKYPRAPLNVKQGVEREQKRVHC
jgi:tol-pal system protein YbgF